MVTRFFVIFVACRRVVGVGLVLLSSWPGKIVTDPQKSGRFAARLQTVQRYWGTAPPRRRYARNGAHKPHRVCKARGP